MILLMIVAVACDDPEPTAAPTTATTATVTTPEPSPKPVSVEALGEATAASMRALESAHIEGHITMTARVTGEEGTVEMSMLGDYQAPDRTRLSVSLTMEGNDFQADYTTIANETYIQVQGTDVWQVSDSSDGLDLRETLRFDPEGVENLVLIGEEELDGEKVYHLRGFLAGDAGGLLNSAPGALVWMTPLGEVVVEVELWIGIGDFLVRRTVQYIDIELSSDITEGGELNLKLDMRLSDYGDPVDIQAPDVESALGTGPGYSETTPIPAPTATPVPAIAIPPTPESTPTPAPTAKLPATATPPPPSPTFPPPTSTPEQEPAVDLLAHLLWSYETGGPIYFSPTVVDGVLYAGSSDHHLYSLDATTGELLWRYEAGGEVVSSPAVVDRVVYVGSQDNHLYALDASTGELLWRYEGGGGMSASPTVVDGVVYVGSEDDNVYALDASTGGLLWRYETGGDVLPPVVVDGVLYVGAWNDHFYALAAPTGELL